MELTDDVPARGVAALRADTAERADDGTTPAVRTTVVPGRRVAERDAAPDDTPDTAAPVRFTSRLSRASPRATAVVAAADAPPRGLGAWAEKASPAANNAATAIEILKNCVMRMLKTYISLLKFYHISKAQINTEFTLCNNLPHF